MIRFTYEFIQNSKEVTAKCFLCGKQPVAICTDRMTGEEFWVCVEHSKNKGKCQRRQLHSDFQKPLKKRSDLHINSQNFELNQKLSGGQI